MTSNTSTAPRRRRLTRRTVAIAAVVAGASALSMTLAVPANAEPFNTYAAVGSDTIASVDTSVFNSIGNGLLASYDAVDPTNQETYNDDPTLSVKTKAFARPIIRPAGSGDGVSALRAAHGSTALTSGNWTAANVTQPSGGQYSVDIARSSSGPTFDANGKLVYIPFAIDAFTVAKGGTSNIATTNFTDGDLTNMYNLGQNVIEGGVTYHPLSGSQTAPAGAVTIDLYVPKAGSGTRKDFLAKVGVSTDGSIPAGKTWIFDHFPSGTADAGKAIEEHDGLILSEDPNGITPFSIPQWISQSKGQYLRDYSSAGHSNPLPGVVDRRQGAVLLTIDGVPTQSGATVNPAFPFARVTYNVLVKSQLDADPVLQKLFVSSSEGSPSLVCGQSTKIQQYGFALLHSGSVAGSPSNNTAHNYFCGDEDLASELSTPTL